VAADRSAAVTMVVVASAAATMVAVRRVVMRVVQLVVQRSRSAAVTLAVQRSRPAVATAVLMYQLLLLSRSQCRQHPWLTPRRSSTHAVQLFKPAASSGKLWFDSAISKRPVRVFARAFFVCPAKLANPIVSCRRSHPFHWEENPTHKGVTGNRGV
jgi:hypothetical protein